MPLYEYKCQKCGREFEELVLNKSSSVICPACGASECDKWMSSFRSKSSGGELGNYSPSGGGACGGCHASSCAGCGVSR